MAPTVPSSIRSVSRFASNIGPEPHNVEDPSAKMCTQRWTSATSYAPTPTHARANPAPPSPINPPTRTLEGKYPISCIDARLTGTHRLMPVWPPIVCPSRDSPVEPTGWTRSFVKVIIKKSAIEGQKTCRSEIDSDAEFITMGLDAADAVQAHPLYCFSSP
ncbi:hypothetical protein EDB89DRAFT_2066457 [Lactarius sanguifluus]|nr:hypothetical protein EDB89DRAFT_2066457 [Lactarius sanguifluus]